MAKKRMDKQHDSSTASKFAKVGTAALAIGGGAAVFNNSNFGKKLLSETFPAAKSASKAINKELRNSKALRSGLDKRTTGADLQQAFRVGKKTFKDEALANQSKKLTLRTDKKNSFHGAIKHFEQIKNRDVVHQTKDLLKSELQAESIYNLLGSLDTKNKRVAKNLAQEAFAKIDENAVIHQNKIGFTDFLSPRFKKAGFSAKEEHDFLEYIYNSNKEINSKIKAGGALYNQTVSKVHSEMDSILLESRKRSDGFFSKVDKAIKKVSGTSVDSEMLFKGSRPMTVDDVKHLADKDAFDIKSLNFKAYDKSGRLVDKNIFDSINSLEGLSGDTIFDNAIRIDSKGNVFSVQSAKDSVDDIFRGFSDSTLGRIFGLTDVRLNQDKAAFATFKSLSTGKEAIYDNVAKAGNTTMFNSKIALANPATGKARLFNTSLDYAGNLVMSDSVAEGVLRDNMHGKSARLVKEMVGTNKDLLAASDAEWAQALDLDQTGAPNVLERIKTKLTSKKNENYSKNILKRQKGFLKSNEATEDKIAKAAMGYILENDLNPLDEQHMAEAKAFIADRVLKDNKELASMLNSLTAMHQITDESISSLLKSGNITDKESLKMLNVLNDKNYGSAEELLELVTNSSDLNLFNKDLENIARRGANSDYIRSLQNISQVKTKNIAGYSLESTNVMNVEQVIKRETIKEIMLRQSNGGTFSGIENLENVLQHSNLSKEQSKNLRYLANWSIMQSNLELYNDVDAVIELNQLVGEGSPLKRFDDLLTSSGSFREGYLSMIDDIGSRHSWFEDVSGNINKTYINEYNNYTFMKESALSRLDQVRSINDAIKIAGQAGKELMAGRHDLDNYTTLTQIPQFMVARLSWGVEGFGLNLSNNSTGSTLDMIKNIGLKRILPIMGAFAAYDYLNYESENFTGTSITGASANALANVDKAGRKLAYSTGIGQLTDWWKETSVLGEYWTGSTDFQTADERQEWYDNGYSAVRSGRLWGFGSSNEYRGGNIQYYQPNYLKRAHSNYREVSIYGSAEEKFKHSWLPSIRHPLSPLRALWNPYWLEEKNMEDRPYPLTGKLFAEGTPWGAILNPTVGELIKPVKMLPEIKKRLGNDGRDIRTVLKNINERIKAKGNENDDLLIFEGSDVRNAKYVSYGNPGDGTMNINLANGRASSPGIDFMGRVNKFHKSVVPTGEVVTGYEGGQFVTGESEIIQDIANSSYDARSAVNEMLGGINSTIKTLGKKFGMYRDNISPYAVGVTPDRQEGTYVYTNLVNQMNQHYQNYYSSMTDGNMVDKSVFNNYAQDAMHSVKQLSGIYNFLGDLAFGEQSYKYRYADAGAMTSFSRGFWDSNIGGFGGELMEIARRFFPSEDKSIIRFNPLRNSMPEWMPERFLTGDPFTSLPKGEMRLPGAGFETLNELHPDMFGEYGAFDRFKILADIAPTSEEYKLWRNIARNTVTDPALVKQMQEIQARATKVSGKHEFYDYRYYNNNVEMSSGVVKSIQGSVIELASGEMLNLGGIKLNEEADLTQVLQIGQHINYRTSANAIKRLEDGLITNAVIYKQEVGANSNINKTLVQMGMADKDKEDRTAIGYLANASAAQQTIGAIQEFLGHANIPILHNKYMKIETARESFLNEQVYGSPFTTWDHPIKGFVRPAFNQTSRQSMAQHALAVGSTALFMNIGKFTSESYLKYLAGGAAALTNPSALLGMGTAAVWNLGVKATGIGGKTNVELGAGIGATLGSIAWGYNNADNPLKAATSFALAGESIFKYLKMDELGFGNGKGAMIGALVGLGVSALKNSHFSQDMYTKWIPEETRKRFEIDEYFDRLEYVKYKSLYNQASNRAFMFEGSNNVRATFKRIDKNKEKIAKLKRKAENLSNKYTAEGFEYSEKMQKLTNKIQSLEAQQTALKGGKYTKAAVAYKKAMESTIYGMSSEATSDEILASVPDQYKDYFMNFINENDKNERKKILKMLPEYLRKPLQVAWRENVKEVDSNRKFFKNHKLPGVTWRGWKPNVNLKHVKMKTVQNEGMLLSDFGFYESEKSKMQYHMAPTVDGFDKQGKGAIGYMAHMSAALSGLGVSLQNISVEQTSAPGLWVVGDISQNVNDAMKVTQYGIASAMQGLTSILF